MRETVNPSWRAIEYPPPTFRGGALVDVTGGSAFVAGSGVDGGTCAGDGTTGIAAN
jgi:hypothetical protein